MRPTSRFPLRSSSHRPERDHARHRPPPPLPPPPWLTPPPAPPPLPRARQSNVCDRAPGRGDVDPARGHRMAARERNAAQRCRRRRQQPPAAGDAGIVNINGDIPQGTIAGTGMVLTSGGIVLTNNHVVANTTSLTAQLAGRGPDLPGGRDRRRSYAGRRGDSARGRVRPADNGVRSLRITRRRRSCDRHGERAGTQWTRRSLPRER